MTLRQQILQLVLLTILLIAAAQAQIVFTNPGPKAIGPLIRDLQNGMTIMAVSLRPGDEDFSLLASLRIEKGAKVKSVYITNGEALLPASYEAPFWFLDSERKMEAHRAMKELDIPAHYLNLPDPGVVKERKSVDSTWGEALVDQFAIAIQRLRPHTIVVLPVRNGIQEYSSVLQSTIRSALNKAIRDAQKEELVYSERDSSFLSPWKVQTIWMHDTRRTPATKLNPGSQTRNKIARSRSMYRSRALPRESGGESRYLRIYPDETAAENTFDAGVDLVSTRFSTLASHIRGLDQSIERSALDAKVVNLLGEVSHYILTEGKSLLPLDRSAILQWKLELERLHFQLLDVKLTVTVSDTILAPSQLMFVNVKRLDPQFMKNGKTYIYFTPTYGMGWYFNEKLIPYFEIKKPDTIRILTPSELQYNYPLHRYGGRTWKIGEPFSFSVYHKGSTPEKSYIMNCSVDLLHPPVGTVEITTPDIVWGSDRTLGVRVFSASRDPREGVMKISDSTCVVDDWMIRSTGKDYFLDTTLSISWYQKPAINPSVVRARNTTRVVDSFFVHQFDIQTDTAVTVGLLTKRLRGGFAQTLDRVRAQWQFLSPNGVTAEELTSCNTILVDHDMNISRWSAESRAALEQWVESGGHLVMFDNSSPITGLRFNPSVTVAAAEEVEWTEAAGSLTNEFRETEASLWRSWLHARAWQIIAVGDADDATIVLRAKKSKHPLIVTSRKGKGMITAVALNLEQQFPNLKLSAYKLFSKLLSYRLVD